MLKKCHNLSCKKELFEPLEWQNLGNLHLFAVSTWVKVHTGLRFIQKIFFFNFIIYFWLTPVVKAVKVNSNHKTATEGLRAC